MSKFDRAECERLICDAEKRQQFEADLADRGRPHLPADYVDGWNDALNQRAQPLIDQLQAALAEIDRLNAAHETSATINIAVSPSGPAPRRGSAGAAGYDLYATSDVVVYPGRFVIVRTGVSIELPDATWEAQVRPRSGLTKTGLVAQLGTIDSDYRGEIGVVVANLGGLHESGKPRAICRGDRIAQLVFARVEHPTLVQAGRLSETERGSGGFGSTGR